MSRRPARCTQADYARAMKAAEQAGPGWVVEVRPDGVIRLVRGESGDKRTEVVEQGKVIPL